MVTFLGSESLPEGFPDYLNYETSVISGGTLRSMVSTSVTPEIIWNNDAVEYSDAKSELVVKQQVAGNSSDGYYADYGSEVLQLSGEPEKKVVGICFTYLYNSPQGPDTSIAINEMRNCIVSWKG